MRLSAWIWVFRFAILGSFLTLFFFAQRFWVRRALSLVDRLGSARLRRAGRIFLGILIGALVLALADRLVLHFLPRVSAISRFMQITQLWLFASSLAFLAIRLVHGVEWLWTRIANALARPDAPLPANSERRAFFRYSAYVAGSLPLIAGIYGFTDERLNFTVRKTDVPMAGLPGALDGLRIVQLSDIHIGDFMPQLEVRRAVEMANALDADIAVITGDLVSGHRDPLEACVSELSRLRAPLGVWGCNGNHEIYAEVEDVSEELFRQHGMTLLRQRNVQLDWRGEKFNLIGVDYQRERTGLGARTPMLQSVERLVRQGTPNILLSHNPNSFYRAAELGIDLTLAGHTHGGQVQVEIVDHSWSPASFITSFIGGLYRLPSQARGFAHLYVNRGLGTIGVPARLGVEPEITLLTLRKQAQV